VLWALIGRRLMFQESSSPSEIVDLHCHARFGAFVSPPLSVSNVGREMRGLMECISLKGCLIRMHLIFWGSALASEILHDVG